GEWGGKIGQFIDLGEVGNRVQLDPFNGEPYYLGAFLLGAYQEILGDMHNLFGDTNAVHISVDENGEYSIDDVVKGDTVREVLDYVEFSGEELTNRLRKDAEKAGRAGQISPAQSRQLLSFFEEGLNGYTYLEEP